MVQTIVFSHFNLNELILHVMINMYVMLMLMLWDVHACLTPRGVTLALGSVVGVTNGRER
jgi:hypothetical protein